MQFNNNNISKEEYRKILDRASDTNIFDSQTLFNKIVVGREVDWERYAHHFNQKIRGGISQDAWNLFLRHLEDEFFLVNEKDGYRIKKIGTIWGLDDKELQPKIEPREEKEAINEMGDLESLTIYYFFLSSEDAKKYINAMRKHDRRYDSCSSFSISCG